ncbi:MAG: hypothetical protein LBU68_01130 [Rickettsiales bacterium]|jgi:tetratricopeptide (TPR) repeat protein|nr:hypothetical protein [Rickettsiales bacterium]
MDIEKKKLIRTLIICVVIVLGFLLKDTILEFGKQILNPPPPLPEYMSEIVPETRLEKVEGQDYYIEVQIPKEEVQAKVEDVKAKDHLERVGLKAEMKTVNRELRRRPTKELYKKRANMTFKEMYVYRDLKKSIDFTADFVKATAGDNIDWKSPALAGMGFILMGEHAKANQYIRKSLSIKQNATGYWFLSEMYIAEKNYGAALRAIIRCEEIFRSPDFEPLTINYSNEDIRPFTYELEDYMIKDRKKEIEMSIKAVKDAMQRDPTYKPKAKID